MSTPTERNRLDEEASPYLRQHADNPVHWQPWDEDALAAARERDVPIFLSIGYAACHWCHVMEEESFVDDAVAERLNEDFVPVKVDREERPDLDSVYQTVCQLVTGSGGWPLSVFCTPEGEPFHVGTYFPRESRRGMPGFLDVLDSVADSWVDPEEREELESRAGQLTSRVRGHLESVPEAADESAPDAAAAILGGGPAGGGDGTATEGGDGRTAAGGDGPADEPGESGTGAAGGGADGPAIGGDAADAGPTPVERAAVAALRNADREHGGWGSGPKFPQPTRVEVLLEATAAAGDDAVQVGDAAGAGGGPTARPDEDAAIDADEFESAAVAALAAMVDGGLYDHVGGGFHRYCTDREWVVPHFEKMLYDNAEIPRALLGAYQRTGRERFATVVTETFDFLDRELGESDGGAGSSAMQTSSDERRESDGAFASTLDARSSVPPERTDDGAPGEDEEGAFYVWTPDEVAAALEGFDAGALLADVGVADGDRAAVDLVDLVCERYGITAGGNFEGRTVLTVDASLQELADERDLEPGTIRAVLDGAREALREHRAERPRPRRDDKVIGAWNGLAIRALADGAIALRDDHLAERAREALDAVRARLWDGERLARRYVLQSDAADVRGEGYLEDYAFLGRGALACYEATGDPAPLGFALDLADVVVEAFYDEDAGTLYFTPASGQSLIARPQEPMDQSTPSSLGVGADLLAALDAFVPHDRYGNAAEAVVRTHARSIERQPLQHPSLALAAERVRSGSTEVTIAAGSAEEWGSGGPSASASASDSAEGESTPGAADVEQWRDWLAGTYLPRRLLAPRPATDAELDDWLDDLGLAEAPPIWAGREADAGPTAYVCRGFTCSRPLLDPADASEWLGL